MLLSEGLYIALAMEKRGISLYSRASQMTGDGALRELLSGLEADERSHYAAFYDMLCRITETAPTEEALALASARAADAFFPGGLMQVSLEGALQSRESMLRCAIGEEEKSIGFYQQLATERGPEQQKILYHIVQEEKKHRATLISLCEKPAACSEHN